MKKNSFGQGLAVFLVVIGIFYIIGAISEASEPKCIKSGCDNKQATNSSYCYLHKPYTGSSSSHSSSSYSNKSTSSSSSSSYNNKSTARSNTSSYNSSAKKRSTGTSSVTDLMNCHGFAYMNCHQIDLFSVISQPHRAAA